MAVITKDGCTTQAISGTMVVILDAHALVGIPADTRVKISKYV